MHENLSASRERARKLRRECTDVEARLWSRLRARQICDAKFRRQHPIGPFIVDFCCVERGLVIELDGGQHAEQVGIDESRTKALKHHGFRVLRFWNNEVLESMEAVVEQIARVLRNPHPCPLPKRAREKR
jgi:very-short-patch-repair endonuclease